MKVIRKMVEHHITQQPVGAVHFLDYMSSDDYLLHRTKHSAVISAIFRVSVAFSSRHYRARQLY